MKRVLGLFALGLLGLAPAWGQQTGSISGVVTLADGEPVQGVAVEASGDVLPQPRSTSTSAAGTYQLPLLPPGHYTLTFSLEGMSSAKREIEVLLDHTTTVDITIAPETMTEEVTVVSESLIDKTSAEIKTAVQSEVLERLPVGRSYQDLVKLIPGVQYTEDTVRGPSAGGSGQDNVYLFDGVNVTLPLFGTLPSELTSHDIDQVAILKGGAKASEFNRAGGFTINSVSKSGTDEFHGAVSYQLETADMASERKVAATQFEQDRDWTVASLGGPVIRDRLFFYTSWYHPTVERSNRSNPYGEVPNFKSERDELFGKLSWSVTNNLLLHASYRDSQRDENGSVSLDVPVAGSTASGDEAQLAVGIFEGSWVLSSRSLANFKYTDYELDTGGSPDQRFDLPIRLDGSVKLDVANLDTQGLFIVPAPISGQTAFNSFIAPLIERYGFLEGGVRKGGGRVGAASAIDLNNFYREGFQAGYDYLLGEAVSHELHLGYQWYRDEEDLSRLSNGWGTITVCGLRTTGCSATGSTLPPGGTTAYVARFNQQTVEAPGGGRVVPMIHSEFESQSIELNDVIKWGDWAFNAGVLLSNDRLFGQGLRPNSANPSGFELAPGHKYEMYEIGFGDMVQPRLGVTWAYNSRDTISASYAKYFPAAGSLPRAASWDRNLVAEREAFFDSAGNFLGSQALASSSGKFFDDGLDPRGIEEFVLSSSRQLGSQWTGRLNARYRYGNNFWEDTNNTARVAFRPPPGIPQEPYIPNLAQLQQGIGGSSYVIAELDGAFTKYYEAGVDFDWRGRNAFVRTSYVWSHYYGNFDQDNTTTENDASVFIGSSFVADGAGRQLWDHRYGDLRGDRRHQVKVYGYYNLPWNANAGAFAVYQSGQPWEVWDVEPYRALTSSSSSASRFAEPAGSRRTDSHYQIDLSYSQNFKIGDRFTIQLHGNAFNVTNNQTGYNIQNQVRGASGLLLNFGEPRDFYEPRRFQVALKLLF